VHLSSTLKHKSAGSLGPAGCLALIALFHAESCLSQGSDSGAFAELTNAMPIERNPPEYPASESDRAREGWVLVSFMISGTGTVIEPMVEESSGSRPFEVAALDAVESWTFEPARLNGEPVVQSRSRVWIAFQLDVESRASREFVSEYRRAAEQLGANDLAAAGETISRIESSIRSNLYEDALYWWIRSIHLEASNPGARDEIKKSISRAIGYQGSFLPAEILVPAIRRLYVMEFEDGDLSKAIDTYELLGTIESAKTASMYEGVSQELALHVEQIRALVAGPNVLGSRAELEDNGYWFRRLLRRSYSIEQIEGEIERLDLRCRSRAAQYSSVTEGEVLAVPEGWEGCSVYVKGVPGTRFALHEHPDVP